jgi:hypothetical protein
MDKMIQLNAMRKQHVMQRFWHGHSCTQTPNIWYVVCSTLPTLVSWHRKPQTIGLSLLHPFKKKQCQSCWRLAQLQHNLAIELKTLQTRSHDTTCILYRHLRYLLMEMTRQNYGMLGNNRSSGGFQKSTQKSVPKQKERDNRDTYILRSKLDPNIRSICHNKNRNNFTHVTNQYPNNPQ